MQCLTKTKSWSGFCAGILFAPFLITAEDTRPIFPRDIDKRQILQNHGGETPSTDVLGVTPCRSIHSADVFIWRNQDSQGNDQNPETISYYYSPCLFFKQDPQTGRIKIETKAISGRGVSVVSLWMVQADARLIQDLVDHVSYLENKTMSSRNLSVVPIEIFELSPRFAEKSLEHLALAIRQGSFPNKFRLDFEIPNDEVDATLSRITEGLTFNIRYAYKINSPELKWIATIRDTKDGVAPSDIAN